MSHWTLASVSGLPLAEASGRETQLMRPQGFPVGDKVSKVTRQVGPRGYTDARKKEGEGRGSS